MRTVLSSIVLLSAASCVTGSAGGAGGEPVLSGPYLGQQTPGLEAEVFAPGIVSTGRWEYNGVFSPGMEEFYVLKDDAEEQSWLVVYRNRDGRWDETVLWRRAGTPTFSPDGRIMHLGRGYRERTADGWSEIERLGGAFEDYRIMRLTSSNAGTYFFDEVGSAEGDGRIRYSRVVDGRREAPRLASAAINSGTMLAHPFIAPDESYLLFDGEKAGGHGESDLYVSFRQDDGNWGAAVNLGDAVNGATDDFAATVTPDGKYLFFNRSVGEGDVDIYWVDARVIENARP